MAGGLRKDTWTDGYYVTGSLDGVSGPGRRTVRRLELRRLSGVDLSVLRQFPDLRIAEFERVADLDLEPLAGLPLTEVGITHGTGINLEPLQRLENLESLSLFEVDPVIECPLTLPASMREIAIVIDDPQMSGEPLARIVEAIDWSRLGGLRDLALRVGGNNEMEPVTVDLGFLGGLPQLERLDLYRYVWHDGPDPSPLEPPFQGLSKQLNWVRIDAWEPERVRKALDTYLGRPAVTTYQREQPTARPEWAIMELGDEWHAYGSLHRAEHALSDTTEYAAARRARGKIRATDPQLARRLDFDPESAGTGIAATTRADLHAALAILGLTPAENDP
jgi:hypothetical protein